MQQVQIMDIRQIIGERVKKAREEAGIHSISDLAERSGVDRKLLYMYEAGERLPKPTAVAAIAKVTQVDPAWIMGMTDKKVPLNQYLMPSGSDGIAFKRDFLDTKQIHLLQMTGNTMEPTLKAGDWVVIDTHEKNLSEGIFAIKFDEEIIIRRIQRTLDGGFLVIADNKEYPPQSLPDKTTNKLKVFGKVILFSRKIS